MTVQVKVQLYNIATVQPQPPQPPHAPAFVQATPFDPFHQFAVITVVELSSVRFQPTSSNIHQPPSPPFQPTGDPLAPEPIQPLQPPDPIYITYLLHGIMVVNAQNAAFIHHNHHGFQDRTVQSEPFAVIHAPPPHQVPVQAAARFHAPPHAFTIQAIRFVPDDQALQAFCHTPVACGHHGQPFQAKFKVQFDRSQSP